MKHSGLIVSTHVIGSRCTVYPCSTRWLVTATVSLLSARRQLKRLGLRRSRPNSPGRCRLTSAAPSLPIVRNARYYGEMVGNVVLAACSIVIAAIVALCAVGRIPRNSIAGLRLPALFASDGAWEEGHRAAIIPTVTAAFIAAGLSAAALAAPRFAEAAFYLTLAVFLIGLVVAAFLANRAAHVAQGSAEQFADK